MEKRNARDSNIELLRIVAMIAIIASHYVTFGILNSTFVNKSWQDGDLIHRILTFIIYTFMGGGNTSVAIFFIITGFYKIKKDSINVKKIIGQVFFYSFFSILLFLIFYKIYGINLSKKNILGTILACIFVPNSSNLWWFVTAYLIIIVFSPVINPFLRKLSKNKFKYLLFAEWLFLYSIANFLTHFGNLCPYYDLQRSLLFYSIGAYIGLHYEENNKRISFRIFFTLILILLYSFQRFFQYDLINRISYSNLHIVDFITRFIGQCILVPCIAINLFIIFKSLTISSAMINKIAFSTFGVYLLHTSPLISGYIWNNIFKVLEKQYFGKYYIIQSIFTIFLIFVFCTIIDLFRQKLFVLCNKFIKNCKIFPTLILEDNNP